MEEEEEETLLLSFVLTKRGRNLLGIIKVLDSLAV